MFRRQEDTIGPDPSFKADLQALGFFINSVGQIRMIEAPDKDYVFHSTNNDRFNVVQREAMQECSRRETEKRLSLLGINRIYLPEFTTTKPAGPHVPILSPSPEILKTRKRVIVLVNGVEQDLGILAYRQMQRELGLNGASVVNFVKRIIKRSVTGDVVEKYNDIFDDGFKVTDENDVPALIVMNTGQSLYSHKRNTTMTMRSWGALPRKSISHGMIKIDEEENRVPGHRNPQEHIKSVFETVLCNPKRVAADAEVYMIATEDSTEQLLKVLGESFEKYGSRITGMALTDASADDSSIKDARLKAFLRQRTREWRYSVLSANPQDCTGLPDDYLEGVEDSSASDVAPNTKAVNHVAWNETVPKAGTLTSITKALHRLVLSATPIEKEAEDSVMKDNIDEMNASTKEEELVKQDEAIAPADPRPDNDIWSSGNAVLCPTFAGGDIPAGECILTNASVQDAILTFFEDTAQDSEHYRNPPIKTYTQAPQPSADNPLVLDPDNPDLAAFPSLPEDMSTPEQNELDTAKEKLENMKFALKSCPADVPEVASGRQKLADRITAYKVKIEQLEQQALAAGALTAGEAPEKRENWQPQTEGPKVPFAGSMVDSELLKAAGLGDAVDEELKKLAASAE